MAAEKMTEWIKFSERKPEGHQSVLAYFGPTFMSGGMPAMYTVEFINGIGRTIEDGQDLDEYIKFWMPLPLPPKDK